MNGNFLTIIGNALTQMYSAQAGFFLATGVSIFWSIVAINIFLLGLDSFSGRLTQEHFIRRVGMILIVGSLMGCYASPLPGAGVSFPHLVIDEAKTLSDRLEGNSETLSQDKLNAAVSQMEQPTSGIGIPNIGSVLQGFYYFLVIIMIGVERFLLIVVLALSYLSIGVVVLVGPMFMPWVLFPGLEHLAWGWFNALLQFCFYQVVGGAMAFLNSIILLGFFNMHPLPWALNDIPVIAIEFFTVIGISAFGVFMVPAIASSIIGGASVSGVGERRI